MILALAAKGRKTIACVMMTILYCEAILPSYAFGASNRSFPVHDTYSFRKGTLTAAKLAAKVPVPVGSVGKNPLSERKKQHTPPVAAADLGGPGQPESQSFHSVNNDNLVNLFSGDFSYNIPLMDVGGYPIALGYSSGISMDQEASWVGLGWNINPGTITRNMRGLPDDFNGTDSIVKTASVKESKTVGVNVGGDVEIGGFPVTVGAGLGVTHNSYKGWGLENSVNASLNVGSIGMGQFTGGLSITNSSQEGITLSPSLSVQFASKDVKEEGGMTGSLSTGLAYNSRSGMKALQFSAGIRQYYTDANKSQDAVDASTDSKMKTSGGVIGSYISFAYPAYSPTINMPFTNSMYAVTLKAGFLTKVVHPNLYIKGYIAKQSLAEADKRVSLPAYGYLNYQHGAENPEALMDFNREKEIPYREKPAIPHIAVPSYTYDVFSMSGEGTGGMFRAYRGDVGFVYDHQMSTKDLSLSASGDIGFGDVFHAGVDLNYTRSFTQSGPWVEQNPLAKSIAFKKQAGTFEAAYFRNPGEKAINSNAFYNAIGGDDVVAVDLYQAGISSPVITTTNFLNRYKNKRWIEKIALPPGNIYKQVRDKRTQVISYLTAKEASEVGLNKYIDNYTPNTYGLGNCDMTFPDNLNGDGVGLLGEYFSDTWFRNKVFERVDTIIDFKGLGDFNLNLPAGAHAFNKYFAVRWTGRIKADVTGPYKITLMSDDGVVLYVNDSLCVNSWVNRPPTEDAPVILNLVGGEFYNIRLEYYQSEERAEMSMRWESLANEKQPIPRKNLYLMPDKDTFVVNPVLSREKRVNDFRKNNHISEINVLNPDGRRYVYGIPVYNLKQKDATFSVNAEDGNNNTGLVKYNHGTDNTTANKKGNDNFFSSEEIPAYAHSFLLTGILSPDYVDLTGDGISDDDPGDAVKFNYSKISGIKNPFTWRSPDRDSANYNEGLKTDRRDDRGSYVYGEKELWYLHSIESKNMIATFKTSNRNDLLAVKENGQKSTGSVAKQLDEINLYTKADFLKRGVNATPVKTVHFEYTHELCPGINNTQEGKLTLKAVWFEYNGNKKGKKNPYVFNYNKNNPGYNARSYDRWGNYKSALDNPGSTTANTINNAEYPYAIQDSTVAAKNAGAWTLDSIVLPSGGRLKVTYESDDYAYVQNRRAMQMFKVAGFSRTAPQSLSDLNNELYGSNEKLYIGIHVTEPVKNDKELQQYLEGIDKIYFKMFVKMPSDKFGSGGEYVNCYARINRGAGNGFINNGKTIWVKLSNVTTADGGEYGPLAKAAAQFLRLNLPSKAYPGSDVGDNLDLVDGVKVLFSLADNIKNAVRSFDATARSMGWAKQVDTSRTLARLNSPFYKKYGGGLRVKRIVTYDHWNAMTKQKESMYGQEYEYKTTKNIQGVETDISSGVASYEPMMGGEENPWRMPVEYEEQVAALAPTNLGYTEEPLGESFFPSASVGYSKVRVRTLNTKNRRSTNGFTETCHYTSYDFPTITDQTMLADSKKRFKPGLANFLRINARHFLAISQGFKVELNDMNGKVKSTAAYAENDLKNPTVYTENYYRVDNQQATFKHLNNTVMAMNPRGVIDTATSIGKDVELMMDMRQQRSVTNGINVNINGDLFSFGIPPVMFLPSWFNFAQREENIFRTVAATKIINRHGILDSVIAIDKGSKVVTRNLLYDSETGEVLLTSTQNEFGDPVFQFTYPAAWAYDGMSGAYKNIDLTLQHIYIRSGKINMGIPAGKTAADYFASGDEILIYSKQKTGGADCAPEIATFPTMGKIWAVDVNLMSGGAPDIYFIDQHGKPFTGNDITLKIIRSGRKNIAATIGTVNTLVNPLQPSGSGYAIVLNNTSKVIAASATEYNQFWKVADNKKPGIINNCVPATYPEYTGPGEVCKVYSNKAVSQSFTRTNCSAGFEGGSVVYTINAGLYFSSISQADADTIAAQKLRANGPAYANANGTCTKVYYNVAVKDTFWRTNCAIDFEPGKVGYDVPANKYKSLISQVAADDSARADLNLNGPKKANLEGTCTQIYYNTERKDSFLRTNCSVDHDPGKVQYTVPAKRYRSLVSQTLVNDSATVDLNLNGPKKANLEGTCTQIYYNTERKDSFLRTNCGQGLIPGKALYKVFARTHSSLVSQAEADTLAAHDLRDNGPAYANANATCTQVYYNVAVKDTFWRTNCAVDFEPGKVGYDVPANKYKSLISQVAADDSARADLNLNGPKKANLEGTCTQIYYNTERKDSFLRTNCPVDHDPGKVQYTVPAKRYRSLVSQTLVNDSATVDLNLNGPKKANLEGTCTQIYYNTERKDSFLRTNCGQGLIPGKALYKVFARTHSSLVSQAEADTLAAHDLRDNGPAYANANATCTNISLVKVFNDLDREYFVPPDPGGMVTKAVFLLNGLFTNQYEMPLSYGFGQLSLPEGYYRLEFNVTYPTVRSRDFLIRVKGLFTGNIRDISVSERRTESFFFLATPEYLFIDEPIEIQVRRNGL
jgi:hypothetical protein